MAKKKKRPPKPFGSEEALELARKGPKDWNAWANKKENAGREVDFWKVDFTAKENEYISFEGFTFPGEADFMEAKFRDASFDRVVFKGNANFSQALVEKDAWFEEAVFNGDANFIDTLFKVAAFFRGTAFGKEANFITTSFNGVAGFNNATFKKGAMFIGTTFAGLVSLDGSQFGDVPDFRGTDFKKHVTLHGMKVDFRQTTEPADADKYRRLKELAVNARDHDREQEFFAYELMAKRRHETHGLKLIPNYLYEWTSDFGRSLWRPCIGLLGVWFAFGVFYSWFSTRETIRFIWDGLLFSVAQLFPFLGASKGALKEARTVLFGEWPLGALVNFSAIVEGGLGILFLFLIGLALRNRFRI